MFKQALILLATFNCFALRGTAALCSQDSTAVETVAIKVSVIPQTNIAEIVTKKADPASYPKKRTTTSHLSAKGSLSSKLKNEGILDTPRLKQELSNKNTFKENILRDTVETKNYNQAPPKSFVRKNLYFLIGLFLLIAGIIIILFFRSGLSLITGIILIIAGYYILLYSLLFMV